MLALLREENTSSDGFQVAGKPRCRDKVKKTEAKYWGHVWRWDKIMQMVSKRKYGAPGMWAL